MRFKVNWNAFRMSMANYPGTIYVEETPECFRLFMCPNETVWTEVAKSSQVQDFRFVETFLQKNNIVKVEQVDWTITEAAPEPAPDEELQDPEGELLASLEELADEPPKEEKEDGVD